MLRHRDVVPYLLARDLIHPQQIVEGDLRVADASRRNNNFEVISEHGPSYLIKQGVGAAKAATVANEAAVYAALQGDRACSDVARYLPRFYAYDPQEHVLILELVPKAETLLERHYRLGRFSTALATRIGCALAALHNVESPDLREKFASSVYAGAPHWVLSVHRPYLRDMGEASSANIQTVKIVQRFPEFCRLLDELSRDWQATGEGRRRPTDDGRPMTARRQKASLNTKNEIRNTSRSEIPQVPLHCDIKWNNVIAVRPEGRNNEVGIKLVDWELARLGDPCWDVGSVFADYLSFWLLSIPVTGQDPPDRFLNLAKYPLEKMRPAISAFWQSYKRKLGLDRIEEEAWLLRSVRYAGARLVQTAYEQGQGSAQLTGNVVCLLQLSLNILQRPSEAAVRLLGISARSRWSWGP